MMSPMLTQYEAMVKQRELQRRSRSTRLEAVVRFFINLYKDEQSSTNRHQ